jgi:hypothetical protein
MTSTSDIPWKRIAVEASAIVASILLAFGIDALWEERKDRAEEAELLTRLTAEFSLNIERMELLFWWIGRDASLYIYNTLDSALDRGESTSDTPALTLRRALWSPTFEANTPVLDGIIRSGRLELIQIDQELKGLFAVRIENDFASKNIFDQARTSAENLVDATNFTIF